MAGRRAGAGLALAAVALSAAGCGIGGSTKTVTVVHVRTHTITVTHTVTVTTTGTTTATAICAGDQVSGTFNEAPGGGGAGQIEYILTLKNSSGTACKIGETLVMLLLDAKGSLLPTHAEGASVLGGVTLQPGGSAKATARFSPDVPGKGDATSGPCQPKAYTLRITPIGGGTIDAPIKPPTSVCERGTLDFTG